MPTVIFNPFRHGKEPDQVTGQSASADSTSQITVSWNAVTASPAVTNYTIEWSANGSSGWAEIAESPTASTSVADASLSTYTTYYYRIKANNPVGSGDYSGNTSATTDGIIPNVPTGLAVAVSSPNLVISWNAATGGNPASYTYTVQRSTSSGSGYSDLTGAVDISATSATDSTVSMGTTYYYKVKATNAFGSSAYSSYASGSVPLPTWTTKTDYLSDMRFAGASSSSGNSFLYIAGNGLLSQVFATSSSIWNGSTWTAKNTLSTGRAYLSGAGGSTSGGSALNGYVSGWGTTGVLEQFDGTNWSTVSGGTDTATTNGAASGQSTGSLMRAAGYSGGSLSSSSTWNGTAWSASGTMGRSNYYGSGTGSGSSALQQGGNSSGTPSNTTEKFTSGTWSTVANASSVSKAAGMAGITSDAIRFGGFNGSSSLSTNIEYSSSGNTWTARNSMPAAQWGGIKGNMGSTTSALWATSSNGGANRKKVYQYG